MKYVDGFVLPIPKKNLTAYRAISRKAGKIWREHGALAYVECAGDELDMKMGVPFSKMVKLKPGETAWFSWIVYKSKTDRNRINAKVMNDPRLEMDEKKMPFDMKRMAFGGFRVMVDL